MTNARVKNYVFELIRLNYISSYNISNCKFKQLLTENLILKYFTSIVLAIDNQENLNMMSTLIIDICFYTQDLKFFDKILMRILDLHNHFKEFLQESDKFILICKFQNNTFIFLFNRLSNSFQTEKLFCFIKKIYSVTKTDLKDNFLLKIMLGFFKTFIINQDFEVFVNKNYLYKLNKLPSQVVLNFLPVKNKNSKKIFENMKTKKINIYEPYLYFKHNKIFEFLIEILKSDSTNTSIAEEILELFIINTKNIFFFKNIPQEILLKIIFDQENLKKYLTNKRFFDLLVGILIISPFNYSTFISQGQLNAKTLIKSSYEFFKKEITKKILSEVIYLHSDKLKDKMLDLCMSSLKDILKSMKNITGIYKKNLNNQLNKKDNVSSNQTISQTSLINQSIFVGLNTTNQGNVGITQNFANFTNPASINGSSLYQNQILYFSPKEKVINLNSLTEANLKEDNSSNFKDNSNRNQVNFKNFKQFMDKIMIIIRVYVQSYFNFYMNSILNQYLNIQSSNTNYSPNLVNANHLSFVNNISQINNSFNYGTGNNVNMANMLMSTGNLNNSLINSFYSQNQLQNVGIPYLLLNQNYLLQHNGNPNTLNLSPSLVSHNLIPNTIANNGIPSNNTNFNNSFNAGSNKLNISVLNNNLAPNYNLNPNAINNISNGNPNMLNFANKMISNFHLNDNPKENFNDTEKLKNITHFYTNFLETLYDMRNLAYYKPSISISILYTLFSLKEVIYKFGDELILKTIYLVMNIGWTHYENEIHKVFNENFNIKFRKFEFEKIRAYETSLKKEFINFLSDIVIYNLVDKTTMGQNILVALNSLMRNKNSRENIFLDICRWNVVSKSIRDNMKNEYRNKIPENSQIFIGTK